MLGVFLQISSVQIFGNFFEQSKKFNNVAHVQSTNKIIILCYIEHRRDISSMSYSKKN